MNFHARLLVGDSLVDHGADIGLVQLQLSMQDTGDLLPLAGIEDAVGHRRLDEKAGEGLRPFGIARRGGGLIL